MYCKIWTYGNGLKYWSTGVFLSESNMASPKFEAKTSKLLLNPPQIKIRLLLKGFFLISKKKQLKNFVAAAMKYIPRWRIILYSSPKSTVLHSVFVLFLRK